MIKKAFVLLMSVLFCAPLFSAQFPYNILSQIEEDRRYLTEGDLKSYVRQMTQSDHKIRQMSISDIVNFADIDREAIYRNVREFVAKYGDKPRNGEFAINTVKIQQLMAADIDAAFWIYRKTFSDSKYYGDALYDYIKIAENNIVKDAKLIEELKLPRPYYTFTKMPVGASVYDLLKQGFVDFLFDEYIPELKLRQSTLRGRAAQYIANLFSYGANKDIAKMPIMLSVAGEIMGFEKKFMSEELAKHILKSGRPLTKMKDMLKMSDDIFEEIVKKSKIEQFFSGNEPQKLALLKTYLELGDKSDEALKIWRETKPQKPSAKSKSSAEYKKEYKKYEGQMREWIKRGKEIRKVHEVDIARHLKNKYNYDARVFENLAQTKYSNSGYNLRGFARRIRGNLGGASLIGGFMLAEGLINKAFAETNSDERKETENIMARRLSDKYRLISAVKENPALICLLTKEQILEEFNRQDDEAVSKEKLYSGVFNYLAFLGAVNAQGSEENLLFKSALDEIGELFMTQEVKITTKARRDNAFVALPSF
jgi:hypothetical protein